MDEGGSAEARGAGSAGSVNKRRSGRTFCRPGPTVTASRASGCRSVTTGDVALPFRIGDDLKEMNSAELLMRYRDTGSDEAFTELVRRYTDLVFSVAKRRLGNAALAEEAAQVVFMRFAQVRPR